MTIPFPKILIGALVVPALALVAACGSQSTDSASKAARTGGSSQATAPGVPTGDAAGTGNLPDGVPAVASPERGAALSGTSSLDSAFSNQQKAENAPTRTGTTTETQAIISKGQISLHSKDIDATRFDLQKLLDTVDGTITDEQSNADKSGRPIRQRLVLRVPSKSFSRTMDGISKLPGVKLVSRSRNSEDVTTQVIDNATRVRTQRASLARVQALLAQATSLNQIISIESQLSRRQADLDSLEAQQKYLADQTSLATINVYLTVPAKKAAAHHRGKDHGFLSGLHSGWRHLGSSTSAVLTGVGAVLPFAALLALIGLPAWLAWRRRSPRPRTEPAPGA